MAIRGVALLITYSAVDTSTGVGKTGDVANHTMNVLVDAAAAAATNTPTEVGNGEYELLLTAAEMDAGHVTVYGSSATANVVLIPRKITTGQLVTLSPAVGTATPAARAGTAILLDLFRTERKTFVLTAVDAVGSAIDLSAKTLRFVVHNLLDAATGLLDVEAASISISGVSNEVANVLITEAQSAVAVGQYGWVLWDVTANSVILHGRLNILPAVKDVV